MNFIELTIDSFPNTFKEENMEMIMYSITTIIKSLNVSNLIYFMRKSFQGNSESSISLLYN